VIVDYHCHLAPDDEQLGPRHMTDEWIAVYAAAAKDRGIAELALTEHGHRFVQAAGISQHVFWNETAHADLDAYVASLATARDAGLPIRAGIELDWLGSDRVEELRTLVADRDFDIVLGSVHWLADGMVDHPDYPVWESHSVDEVWRLYFDELRSAAASGLYDVMAHPDLPKVFGERPRVRRYGRRPGGGGRRLRDLLGRAAQGRRGAVPGPGVPRRLLRARRADHPRGRRPSPR